MPKPLSIRERIVRVYVAILQGVTGIGKVYRWDHRGLRDPATGLNVDAQGEKISMKNGDAMIILDDETADEGGQGSVGMTDKILPVEIHLKIAQDEDDTQVTCALINDWLLKLETAVMANPLMIETSPAVRLAIDTRILMAGEPPREVGQREAIVAIRCETTYQHTRTDPSTGPGITLLEV